MRIIYPLSLIPYAVLSASLVETQVFGERGREAEDGEAWREQWPPTKLPRSPQETPHPFLPPLRMCLQTSILNLIVE
jgi:hypothetical protein